MRSSVLLVLLLSCAAADRTEDGTAPDAGAPDAGFADAGTPPPGPSLDISVTGARSTDGDVCVAVFDSEASYDDGKSPLFRGCVPFAGQPVKVPGLVPGRTYGVSAFADVNRNAKLDTKSIFGFDAPAEGYGFSNNPPQGFGAPSWEDIRFAFDPADARLTLELRYL